MTVADLIEKLRLCNHFCYQDLCDGDIVLRLLCGDAKMTEYVIGKGRHRHRLLCRWWLRSREVPNAPAGRMKQGDGEWERMPLMEFYVPWWGWPLEILHRCVFGRVKLTAINEPE